MHAILHKTPLSQQVITIQPEPAPGPVPAELRAHYAYMRLWTARALQFNYTNNGPLVDHTEIALMVSGLLPELQGTLFSDSQVMSSLNAKVAELEAVIEALEPSDSNLCANAKIMQSVFQTSDLEQQLFLFLLLRDSMQIFENFPSFHMLYSGWQLMGFYAHCFGCRGHELVTLLNQKGLKYLSLGFIEDCSFGKRTIGELTVEDVFSELFINTQLDHDVLLAHTVDTVTPPTLTKEAFSGNKTDFQIVAAYLKQAVKTNRAGSNILLYGAPGAGKTEFAKVVAREVGLSIYAIPSLKEQGDNFAILDGEARLRAYHRVKHLLKNKNCVVLFDEVSDVFSKVPSFSPSSTTQKAGINSLLETNKTPSIWITNDIEDIDPAYVRRFDVTVEFKPLSKEQRRLKIKSLVKPIDEKVINAMAANRHLEFGVITRAHRVASSIHPLSQKKYAEKLVWLINSTLKAQSKQLVQIEKSVKTEPLDYDPRLVNINMDISLFLSAIKSNPRARICCYGAPGTGKSMFARYVAQELDKPIVVKQASDLLGKYVGENEQRIAAAFTEAKRKRAILVIDEIDTFISSRQNASQGWQTSMVNEMLVQMESFQGLFFATTNLLEQLDAAALRRFDLKLEFKALDETQRMILLDKLVAEILPPTEQPSTHDLTGLAARLPGLAPSDAALIKRQVRFNPIRNFADFADRLEAEVSYRGASPVTSRIGFCL